MISRYVTDFSIIVTVKELSRKGEDFSYPSC